MNRKLRITGAEASGRAMLRITWSDGRVLTVKLTEPIHTFSVLEPLQDPAVFSQVQVGEWGFDVMWPGKIELSATTLYRLAMEQSGQAMPKNAFKEWMHRHGLSLTGAAEALHLTRRTITAYSSGPNPIPYHIALACKGWEVLHGGHGVHESPGQYGQKPAAAQRAKPAGAAKKANLAAK